MQFLNFLNGQVSRNLEIINKSHSKISFKNSSCLHIITFSDLQEPPVEFFFFFFFS